MLHVSATRDPNAVQTDRLTVNATAAVERVFMKSAPEAAALRGEALPGDPGKGDVP